ncbi:MAG: hypothetical protein COA66_09105 [Arcobacter sp.]|nr:MAG: hypothetical protein COA66_09105 [Arcobacter sp.]
MSNDNSSRAEKVDEKIIQNAKNTLMQKKHELHNLSVLFSFLGNEERIQIVYLLLKHKKLSLCSLSAILNIKTRLLEKDLKKLKDAGILHSKRETSILCYFIKPSLLKQIKILLL